MVVIGSFVFIPLVVGLVSHNRFDMDIGESIKNSLIALGLCIVLSLPVGEWETKYLPDTVSTDSRYVYVPPCEHLKECGTHTTYITPVYTSALEMCLCEDDTHIRYCPVCYTRKEAIKKYLAQR